VNKVETAVATAPGGSPVKAHVGLTGRIAGNDRKPWWGVVENTELRHEGSYSPCWPVDWQAVGLGTGIGLAIYFAPSQSQLSDTCVQQSEKRSQSYYRWWQEVRPG
jgi:hypothetical protein